MSAPDGCEHEYRPHAAWVQHDITRPLDGHYEQRLMCRWCGVEAPR